MKVRRKLGLFFALGLVVAAAVFWGLHLQPREPVYQGKRLREWIDGTDEGSDEQIKAAQEAVRHIGTNALPALIQMIDSEDSWPKRKVMQLAQKQSFLKPPIASGRIDQWRAVSAFHVLGAEGKPASSGLLKLVERGPDGARYYALSALAEVRPDAPAVPTLVRCLDDHTRPDYVRTRAAYALGAMGPKAESAIPDLLTALREANDDMRPQAAWALGQIKRKPDVVVPALIESLSDRYWSTRHNAAMSLGEFGTNAKAAVPALLRLLDDPQSRISASNSLKQIAQEAAVGGGAK